ncbi:TPA: hypothetical protein EYN09_12075 [Candidatus Poribacteria bacterium]|nr:hypothetical protein [Candidatus Poribacteria bacterium]HIC16562.1 hypothetical protein [Candidatus Poribacteria bacterium]HIM10540.1 hypothetical protein [Candidatus Poribacteria bacterium]HIO07643.1 hypothetical protein [Candidatus Poribacteria bacterium]HIO49716.1 hypothetical protein [Candidatus Poribacteria bacterium]
MELYWDMEHHIAEFRLNVMEEETPVQLWRTSVPVPTSDAAIDLLKPLKALGDLCYSLYKTTPDTMEVIPDLAYVLFDFRRFMQKLED